MRRIINVSLPKTGHKHAPKELWWIGLNEKNQIIDIQPMTEKEDEIKGEDWQKDFLSPMGVDLQINGGIGLCFNKVTTQDLPKLLKLLEKLWLDGIESICPTLITCEVGQLREALAILKKAREEHSQNRCQLLGAHLEGPFIAKSHIGVHPLNQVLPPSPDALEQIIEGFEEEISMMTLAPELPGANEVIKRLKANNIISCIGHSNANQLESEIAFKNGSKMITHTFNAMNGIHHRAPGPVGAALANGNIALGLIADGVHIDPLIASLLQKLSPRKLVLVSDAVPAYGLKDGEHLWEGKKLIVNKGTCQIKDGPLAGTTLSLLDGCMNLAEWIKDPAAAIWSATIAPREVLWGEVSITKLLIGQPLSKLLRWHQQPAKFKLNWHQAA